MRIARGSLALLCGLAMAGCSVDSGPRPPGTPDGAPEVPDAAGPPPDGAPPPIDATPICTDQTQNIQETGHHPVRYDQSESGGNGAGCLGQCHDGILGEKYTAAGAVYDRRTAGGNPVAGAHIYVIDADGKVVEMISAQNGMFWTSEDLEPPIRSYASACPDSIGMIANASGNCNGPGCHTEIEKIYVRPAL